MKVFAKKLLYSFIVIMMMASILGLTSYAKTTTRNYDIFTTNSKHVVSTKVDYFDVGGRKTCYIYAHTSGKNGKYQVVPQTTYSAGVASELKLFDKALYFDYWVADKNNNWVSGGTVRLGGKIKTPAKGKRIYITTRIEPTGSDFVKKNNVLYANSTVARLAETTVKYYIQY